MLAGWDGGARGSVATLCQAKARLTTEGTETTEKTRREPIAPRRHGDAEKNLTSMKNLRKKMRKFGISNMETRRKTEQTQSKAHRGEIAETAEQSF